jgi:hypothetical protein
MDTDPASPCFGLGLEFDDTAILAVSRGTWAVPSVSAIPRLHAQPIGCSPMRLRDVLHDHFPDIMAPAVQHCLGAINRHADQSLG